MLGTHKKKFKFLWGCNISGHLILLSCMLFPAIVHRNGNDRRLGITWMIKIMKQTAMFYSYKYTIYTTQTIYKLINVFFIAMLLAVYPCDTSIWTRRITPNCSSPEDQYLYINGYSSAGDLGNYPSGSGGACLSSSRFPLCSDKPWWKNTRRIIARRSWLLLIDVSP